MITRIAPRLVLASLLMLAALTARATPWTYPGEISVADAYNRLYGTSYSPDTRAGLSELVADRQLEMRSLWTTADFRFLEMLVFDTASTRSFGLGINGTFLEIFNPGAWTAPSRGWLPDVRPLFVDLVALLGSAGFDPLTEFSFMQGRTTLTATNTYRLETPVAGEWLFAFNDNGGLLAGDQDANEPLFCVSSSKPCTVPEPGTALLLLAGVAALATSQWGSALRKKLLRARPGSASSPGC